MIWQFSPFWAQYNSNYALFSTHVDLQLVTLDNFIITRLMVYLKSVFDKTTKKILLLQPFSLLSILESL